MRRTAFRQPQGNRQRAEHGKQQQAIEDRRPAGPGQQPTTRQRRQDGGYPHDQDQLGKHLGRRQRIAQVTHHGPRDDHAGTAAQRLNEARQDQHLQALRPGAGQRGQGKQADPHQQRAASAKAIGQRPIKQLANGQPGKIGRQAQLHMFDIRGELPGQRRETGQVEIDGQWPEGAQRAKDQQDTQGHAGTRDTGNSAWPAWHTERLRKDTAGASNRQPTGRQLTGQTTYCQGLSLDLATVARRRLASSLTENQPCTEPLPTTCRYAA